MANNYFNFKRFTIRQEGCAMKVGTDGVLLGAWVDIANAANILDIGTGTGLIAIMLAQKSNARIDAIEIEKDASNQAIGNVNRCPWKERINIMHTSFQNFSIQTEQRYDLIVTNPPFFSKSLKAKREGRNLARHNEVLPPEALLAGVDRLLVPSGRFCLILPAIDAKGFISEAALYNLYCKRKTLIRPLYSKNVNRILMEFTRYRQNIAEDELIVQGKSGDYTEGYKILTRDFYLNF